MSMAKIPPQAKKVFEGVIFDVYQWEQEMFDGSTETFEVLKRRNGANIIAQMQDGSMVLIDELQPNWSAPYTGLPAGSSNPGETILQTAQRELLEETGLASDDWQQWFVVSPASKIEWDIYIFIARNTYTKAEPRVDAGERITTRFVTKEQFVEEARKETFRISEVSYVLNKLKADNKLDEFYKLLS